MEAVIATGGKQYRVAPGQVIKVERLGQTKGTAVEFRDVLLVTRDGQVTLEPKALKSAKVTGEVVEEKKGAKVLVVKFKRRKNYRR
ncbi:MAG: 50S ribosomal protein L21, partial [Candidatus Rokubacteria bacterium]|nr:50S ribosomal protein L21 [Candidatus Rokubacteria bacterium]